MKQNEAARSGSANEDFVARAQRAMLRASDQAMEDYKRFGIEPVVAAFPKKASEKVGKPSK